MRKLSIFALLAVLFTLPTFAYPPESVTLNRPTSAGPFQWTVTQVGDNTAQLAISGEGNENDACMVILYDTQAPPQMVTSYTDGWTHLTITIGVPIPLSNKYWCCSFDESKMSMKLATCADGTKNCCGATCSDCCTKYTLNHCWISDNSDCS